MMMMMMMTVLKTAHGSQQQGLFQLNASGLGTVEVVSGESLAYWKNQIKYTDKASTLDKQMRGLSTTSGIINTAVSSSPRSR